MTNFTAGPWTLTHVAGNNFAVQRFELRGMFGDKPNTYPIFQKDCSAIDGATFCASPQDASLLAAAWDMHAALSELRHMLWARPDIAERLRPLLGFAEHATLQRAADALGKAERGLHPVEAKPE